MFTGIVERTGTVRDITDTARGRRISIDAGPGYLSDVGIGDSIAVDGVCQTVVALDGNVFAVEAIGTTLSRTTFADLATGGPVNLERALPLGGRLGGHLVQGHVDATGRVQAVERDGEQVLLRVRLPAEVADVTVLHGSITIQGVSLTINRLLADDVAEVALIPHTWENTTLRRLSPGDAVNLEGDMLGRFVVHYLRRTGAGAPQGE
ncbi:MAG TPA: riboflavin synthase [Longimicrobiales bacterium]